MHNITIHDVIKGMPSRFDADAAAGVAAILQFRLKGEEAIDFHAIIRNNICETRLGLHNDPTLVLKMSTQTYMDMAFGKLSGQQAFFQRKLRYEGPISLAVKLHRFFRPPKFA